MKTPKNFQVIKAVARVTFQDIVRDRILYNSVIIAVFMLAAGFLAARLSFIRPERMILDLGFAGISFSSGMIAVLMGAHLFPKEFDRRTIHVALTKPISRFQFLVGKYLGLCMVILVNSLLIALGLVFILLVTWEGSLAEALGDILKNTLGLTALIGFILIFIQSILLGAIAIFFSARSTTSLAIMFTLGVYLVGINASFLRTLAEQSENGLFKFFLNFLSYLFPNFQFFNLGLKITYGLGITLSYFSLSLFYGLTLVCLVVGLSGLLIQSKES